ncbi:pleckstrin homology domain-containing family G member 4B-like isoform X1 [Myxocyprinus asiaticus]|uniref:pleckstrin homology domain-containing family G member 4B-like isoform X1 n=1 Tax=Myxocyprinus asiaticus TaxID=70543 RepID=UPI002222F405|nr:pleckstrin homology domain-containing family G member 4B-like isoform X1 [Myxocyprinus asiaticus]
MGSEAVEDCVQGALSSLYPPFESTAPPLLSQVFSVLESTYQHDSLRYLLDFFIPAKHLLHRLQQHACSQYLGCLFLHSGWPLCLGEKVVVQLSTLDWRLLRSTDFYLQVVPFSTRCPRLALKCLALGGRNVQEVLVPESQHPLVFTVEWLHCINKERGCKREGGGCLDTCLVSTCDGVVRIPWEEVVYPKLLHNPSDPLQNNPNLTDLSHPSGGLGLGWGSSSGEHDSWSWDEEDDLPPDGDEAEIETALERLRRSSEHLVADGAGDYVELLEPRGGPDGGADPKQRYLEMHGICKTKSLPMCRRGKAIRLRRGKAKGFGRTEPGGRAGGLVRRDSNNNGKVGVGSCRDLASLRPLPRVIDLGCERRSYPPSFQDFDEGGRELVGLESRALCMDNPGKERRPGVGKERDGAGCTLPWEESQKRRCSSRRCSIDTDDVAKNKAENLEEGQQDHNQRSHSICDDKTLASTLDRGSKVETLVNPTNGSDNEGIPLAVHGETEKINRQLAGGSGTSKMPLPDTCLRSQSDTSHCDQSKTKHKDNTKDQKTDNSLPPSGSVSSTGEKHVGKSENCVCPRGKEVKTGGFRAPRRKRKAKGGKGKVKSNRCHQQKGKGDHTASKNQTKAAPPSVSTKLSNNHSSQPEGAYQISEVSKDCVPVTDTESDANSDAKESKSGTSFSDQTPKEMVLSISASNLELKGPPPYLRDLDFNLLQSGKLMLTGTMDRLGRALVVTESHLPDDGWNTDEMIKVLSCYYTITRPMAREKGLTVIVDSRKSAPSELCISALKLFKGQVSEGLDSVLILTEEQEESIQPCLDGIEVHTVRGTGILQQFVDKQHLPREMDGDFNHSQVDWLAFRMSLEQLTERCDSALTLLGDALQSMDSEPLPDCIKNVPLSVDKHRQLMTSILTDQRLTELQQRGGAWLAGLANGTSGLAQRSPDCKAALAVTSNLYESVDDALHRLVRVSNQRSRDLEALGRLAALVDRLDKCDREIEHVQEQLEDYKHPPLSLSRLSLKQHKFKGLRGSAMELNSETLGLLGEVESWSELDWAGLGAVLDKLPPIREKVQDMSHCLSDCWTQLDNTQRLLSTLTEASQWCDVVSSSSPSSSSSSPLSSLPPIPPSRFQDARALALDLGGGALLELWSQTLERYQKTLAQFKSRILQAERGPSGAQDPDSGGRGKTPASSMSSLGELEGEIEPDWCPGGGGESGMQSWGSLASLFRPQNCSTLKIGEEKKKEGVNPGGGKFLQNLLHPSKKSPTDTALPPKPPRKRHPSFDLQALLAPRRSVAVTKPMESASGQSSPLSWLGRRALTDPILMTGVAAAVPGWKDSAGGVGGGGVLIRGVEVSSKEVADHTGFTRQHVLLSRTERGTGVERAGVTAQSKLYLQWCRLLSTERQYVAVLKGVEENYLPLLESSDVPSALRGKTESLFCNWKSLSSFHSQLLLPAMEGALSQTLQQTDCFSKYKDQFLLYSHYIHMRPEPDALLISQAADFFRSKLSSSLVPAPPFPQCLSAPVQRLEQYCQTLEELGGLNPTSDSALSILRHAQRHGEDLRASDVITGCPIPLAERGDLVRHGELCVCGGNRRKKMGVRNIFLYQNYVIFTKHKTPSPGYSVYSFKHSIKTGEMGLTQSVGEDGLKFEVWVRQSSRTRDCLTLQTSSVQEREAWTHDIAQLLWNHAIHNTELCLKESLCMGVSSKLLLDVTGAQITELDSSFSLNDRVQSSCSDSSSVGSLKEGDSPASARDSKRNTNQAGHTQVSLTHTQSAQ